MDLRQTPEYSEYLSHVGWVVKTIGTQKGGGKIYVYIRSLPLLLPLSICKVQRFSEAPNWVELERLLSKHHCLHAVLEPETGFEDTQNLVDHGFKLSKSPFLPTATVRIDLTQSQRILWGNLATNSKRILSKPSPISISEVSRDEFRKAWTKSAKVWPMSSTSLEEMKIAFGKKCELLVSKQGDEIVSGLLLLKTPDTAFYYQTWTSPKGRESGAHFHLVWQTMLRLKKEGLKYFDFDGVFDKRYPIKSWKGFSEFKLKFGGELVEYPGSFTRGLWI